MQRIVQEGDSSIGGGRRAGACQRTGRVRGVEGAREYHLQ